MARLNEILVGRFNRVFQKVYGIKGPPPVSTLAPEIMPVHPIAGGVELRWPDGWTRWSFSLVITQTAGQGEAIQIRNPAGSNVIGVVEKITITNATNGTAITICIPQGAGDLANITSVAPMDGRQGAPAVVRSVLIPSFALTTTAVASAMEIVASPLSVFTQVIVRADQEIPVPPNTAVLITTGANLNLAVTFTIQWRERFLEEGERL